MKLYYPFSISKSCLLKLLTSTLVQLIVHETHEIIDWEAESNKFKRRPSTMFQVTPSSENLGFDCQPRLVSEMVVLSCILISESVE